MLKRWWPYEDAFYPVYAVVIVCSLLWISPEVLAGPAVGSPEVEIKKHSTGKEATVRQGEKEWFIHVDVDQDRTMIIRTESDKGRETQNQAEIVERPMSNSEVDHVVNDFVSGIKSTLKP
jgi:hypothetical protein